jgi:CBS-domain-containing membrane protein
MSISSHEFQSLTASDLMSRAVLVIPREMTLRGAARLLSRTHLSGAPVVDCDGHCVGVLSTTDFMRFIEQTEDAARKQGLPAQEFHSASQLVDPEALPLDQVSVYMTADLVTASAATRVTELADRMVHSHIHRLVVIDEDNHPIGIVSSTDILAAVARHGSTNEFRHHGQLKPARREVDPYAVETGK